MEELSAYAKEEYRAGQVAQADRDLCLNSEQLLADAQSRFAINKREFALARDYFYPNSGRRPLPKTSEQQAEYAKKVAEVVRSNLVLLDSVAENSTAVVDIHVSRFGDVISYDLTQRSGSAIWDQAVLRALEKTERLPLDFNQTIPSRIEMAFRPK